MFDVYKSKEEGYIKQIEFMNEEEEYKIIVSEFSNEETPLRFDIYRVTYKYPELTKLEEFDLVMNNITIDINKIIKNLEGYTLVPKKDKKTLLDLKIFLEKYVQTSNLTQ